MPYIYKRKGDPKKMPPFQKIIEILQIWKENVTIRRDGFVF